MIVSKYTVAFNRRQSANHTCKKHLRPCMHRWRRINWISQDLRTMNFLCLMRHRLAWRYTSQFHFTLNYYNCVYFISFKYFIRIPTGLIHTAISTDMQGLAQNYIFVIFSSDNLNRFNSVQVYIRRNRVGNTKIIKYVRIKWHGYVSVSLGG